MDAIDVYNGIARAVEAAKPAQEYCLLWIPHWSTCMTKSEWSGWMQAIGSVASIIGAFLIASGQYKKQIDLQNMASVSRIRTFVASVSGSIEILLDSEAVNSIEMQRQLALVRETLSVASTISADHLGIEWVAALEATRSLAAQMTVLCEAVEKNNKNLDQAKQLARQFQSILETHEKFVANGYLK